MHLAIHCPLTQRALIELNGAVSAIKTPLDAHARPTPPEQWHIPILNLGEVSTERVHEVLSVFTKRAVRLGGEPITFSLFRLQQMDAASRLVVSCNMSSWASRVQELRDALQPVTPSMDEKPWEPYIALSDFTSAPQSAPWSAEVQDCPSWEPTTMLLVDLERLDARGRPTTLKLLPL